MTDPFKFSTEKKKRRKELKQPRVFNKNQTMNVLFCQKKHVCFIYLFIYLTQHCLATLITQI